MKNDGGHFTPKFGGHFELESGGHFKLELGGQYHWNLHVTQELAIALSPAYSMRTRVTAGTLGLGLGFFASFKVQYFTVTDAFKETYKSIKK